MRTILLILPALLSFLGSYAQDAVNPSFEKVKVLYKPLSSSLGHGAQSGPAFQVRAQLAISLKPSCEADSIFLSLSEKPGSPVLYKAAYSLGGESLSDGNGTVLFKQEDNSIQLGCPRAMPLRPYHYSLYTKDSAGQKSPVYSITQ